MITNFSSETAGIGLIMHTTVTIGHDVPWRRVHEQMTTLRLPFAWRTPPLLVPDQPHE